MGKAGRRFLKFWTCGPVCFALDIAAERRAAEFDAKISAEQQRLIAEGKQYEAALLNDEEDADAEDYLLAVEKKTKTATLIVALTVIFALIAIAKKT